MCERVNTNKGYYQAWEQDRADFGGNFGHVLLVICAADATLPAYARGQRMHKPVLPGISTSIGALHLFSI